MTVSLDTANKPVTQASTAAPVRSTADPVAVPGAGFAQQLQQQLLPVDAASATAPASACPPAPAAPPAPACAPTAETGRPRDESSRSAAAQRPTAPRHPQKTRADAAEGTPDPATRLTHREAEPDGEASAADTAAETPSRRREQAAAEVTGDVLAAAHWLQHLLATKTPDAAAGKHAKGGADNELAGVRRGVAAQPDGAATGRGDPAVDARELLGRHATFDAAAGDTAHAGAAGLDSGAERGTFAQAAAAHDVPAGADAAALAAASAAPPPAAVAASAQVTLGTPVNSPEFRDVLAAQVSTFVRDGVQEAVLNLHPADMGPITVQIAMDGTQARVDFQAALPATRDLIEGSLPALASALHGEGLTLSGGSVGDQPGSGPSQHPPHGGDTGRGEGRNEEAAPGRTARAAPAAVPGRRDGAVVDTFA